MMAEILWRYVMLYEQRKKRRNSYRSRQYPRRWYGQRKLLYVPMWGTDDPRDMSFISKTMDNWTVVSRIYDYHRTLPQPLIDDLNRLDHVLTRRKWRKTLNITYMKTVMARYNFGLNHK